MVYSAKTQNFPELSAALARGGLARPESREQARATAAVLARFSRMTRSANEWRGKMFDYLSTHRPLPNVGALARLRSAPRVPLLPLAKLKPAFVVRTPAEFQTQFLIWIALYLAAFHVVFLDLALERTARRLRNPARDSPAHRHRPDPRGEPARSVARHARVQQIRLGRRAGLPGVARAVAARVQLSALLDLVLHAAVRRAGALCFVDAIRLGAGRQRRAR